MDTLQVDEQRIRVYRQGTGRPLLYIHSGAGEVGPIPFFAELEAVGFEVIVPELPGFGHSDAALGWHHITDVVFHLRRTMEALGLDRVVLAGCSVGGWLAAELAAWFPERFEALVLISALGLRVEGAPVYDLFGGPGTTQEDGMARANPHGLDMLAVLGPVIASEDPEEIALHFLRSSTALARMGWDPYMHDPKLLDRLRAANLPTLVIWGADDGVVPVAHGEAYAAALSNVRLEVLAECGHGPILEHPEKVASMIAKLI